MCSSFPRGDGEANKPPGPAPAPRPTGVGRLAPGLDRTPHAGQRSVDVETEPLRPGRTLEGRNPPCHQWVALGRPTNRSALAPDIPASTPSFQQSKHSAQYAANGQYNSAQLAGSHRRTPRTLARPSPSACGRSMHGQPSPCTACTSPGPTLRALSFISPWTPALSGWRRCLRGCFHARRSPSALRSAGVGKHLFSLGVVSVSESVSESVSLDQRTHGSYQRLQGTCLIYDYSSRITPDP